MGVLQTALALPCYYVIAFFAVLPVNMSIIRAMDLGQRVPRKAGRSVGESLQPLESGLLICPTLTVRNRLEDGNDGEFGKPG